MKKSFLFFVAIIIPALIYGQSGKTVFDGVDFTVTPLVKINTVGSDISPFFVDGELYFSSIREDYFNEDRRERKNMAFYDIYSAAVDDKGKISSDRSLVPGFGEEYHEGPGVYCPATGELFTTFSNVTNPDTLRRMISKEDIKLKLVIMKKSGEAWHVVEELPFNDEDYSFAHPAVSRTGDTLVFVSNMPGSIGQNDLFMAVRSDGKWSTPVNLGEKINTVGNDMFPVFVDDGLLTFASDGRGDGMGGLDIYYTTFPQIGEIVNMGDKINSTLDDFGLVLHPGGEMGYFASNRGNVGSDDIFRFDVISPFYVLKGIVIDDNTNKVIPGADVVLKDCNGNGISSVLSNDHGAFSFKVRKGECIEVCATKAGYTEDCENAEDKTYVELRISPHMIVTLDASTKDPVPGAKISCGNYELGKTNFMGEFIMPEETDMDCDHMARASGYLDQFFELSNKPVDTVYMFKKELNKSFVLENIYYDFDKWDILPESEIELNKLVRIMNDNPGIKVELGSHTDSRGSDSYNRWLSQKRSDSAVGYIIGKGISSSRIIAKGYGETQLVNRCSNGVKCSAAEHRRNRRTEFKLIGL